MVNFIFILMGCCSVLIGCCEFMGSTGPGFTETGLANNYILFTTEPHSGQVFKPGDTVYEKWAGSSVEINRPDILYYRKHKFQFMIDENRIINGFYRWIITEEI